MGGLEFIEKKEGFSYGANDMRDGVSIHQERRREPVIKEAEFSELQDLQAFMKLPGTWPVTKIEFELKKRVYTQPYFVPRELKDSSLPKNELLKNEEEKPDDIPVTSSTQEKPLLTEALKAPKPKLEQTDLNNA